MPLRCRPWPVFSPRDTPKPQRSFFLCVFSRRNSSWSPSHPRLGEEPKAGADVLCLYCASWHSLCAAFAATSEPTLVIAVQLLDGISAAILGVLVPLVLADVMRGTGHYNLAQGVVGAAVGVGASLSTAVAGYISDRVGSSATFLLMAAAATTDLLLVIALMPETKGSGEAVEGM